MGYTLRSLAHGQLIVLFLTKMRKTAIKSIRSIKHTKEIEKQRDTLHPVGGFTILELLDRLLDKGVVVKGEIILSIAEIDLVYLNLGLLLSSVKTVEKARIRGGNGEATLISWQNTSQASKTPPMVARRVYPVRNSSDGGGIGKDSSTIAKTLPSVIDHGMEQIFKPKANINPKNVEKGLAKLVLTVVDLLRKLMEKQAVRQMEAGLLTAWQTDRVGTTFLLLDERMEQLKKVFGLKDEDLNLDLGPLGELT